MKNLIKLIFGVSAFLSIGSTLTAQVTKSENQSQNLEASIFKRIDTIVVFDPATNIEQVKIMKYTNILLNVKDCNSPIKRLASETQKVPFMKIRDISGFELKCMGKYVDNWEVKSFDIAIMKNGKKTDTISNKDAHISKAIEEFLGKSNAGDVVSFTNIIVVNPQKDTLMATVDFLLE